MDAAETIRIACVAGPETLRTLVQQTQVGMCAERFSFMHCVLRAVVMHGASLDLLDVLKEQWPGLEVSDTQNGLTELIHLEAWVNSEEVRPDLRASITAAVQDVLRRMPASFDVYSCERSFDRSRRYVRLTLPSMAKYNRAYYTFEALNCPNALYQFTTNNCDFLCRYDPPSRVTAVMQEVIIRLST